MNKDIEMFEITDKQEPIGTEIFDANLPSDIDFEEKTDRKLGDVPINPEKISQLGKVLIIGDEIKSYRVRGKVLNNPQPHFLRGAVIISNLQTHPAKVFDDENAQGFSKLWQSILGYSKREIHMREGFIYIFEKKKEGLHLHTYIKLSTLFKIFVDPEEEKIRLVFREGERLYNRDISPENYFVFLEQLNHELVQLGLSLQE